MKYLFLCLLAAGCMATLDEDRLISIHIEDRNGLSETISDPDRLKVWEDRALLASQPYKKVFRMYRTEGKHLSKITTYHPNGSIWQYLEAQEMRAFGAFREWFANGQLKIEATVIGGPADLTAQQAWLFDGVSRVFDESGHLVAEIPYVQGAIEGQSVYYYPSSQVHKEFSYRQNQLDGPSLIYWPSGALYIKSLYQKGVLEGLSMAFWEDGTPSWIEEYSKGTLRQGVYYTRDGTECTDVYEGEGTQALFEEETLSQLVTIHNGKPEGLVRTFTPSGALYSSNYVKQGKKQGEEIEYYLPEEGTGPKLSLNWDDDSIHGLVKTWYPDGKLESQAEWVRNQKIGTACAWYKDGSMRLVEEYQEGKLVEGKYFRKGQEEPISTISGGNGLATLYDADGLLLRKVAYEKGNPAPY